MAWAFDPSRIFIKGKFFVFDKDPARIESSGHLTKLYKILLNNLTDFPK